MRGIDVSSHNGKIDWKTVKSSGIEFVIIRAGYGNSTKDKYFEANIKGAKEAGIKVGVYWFCYALNEEEARKEADYCYSVIKPYKLDLPVFYDFEYDTERYATENGVKFTKHTRTATIKAFCDKMNEHVHCGVYLNPDYIKNRLNYDGLKAYPLWLANWVDDNRTDFSVSKNDINLSYGNPFMWQFGIGYVLGIEGNVDLNYGYFEAEVDNEPSEWSKEAIEWAVKNKILQGDENGDYKLREPCTTERFITLLYRALKNVELDIGD